MIRFWEQKDVMQLRRLIKAFLENHYKYGSRILPSDKNVSYYLDLGYQQVQEKDPHLVYEENGKILGFIQAGSMLSDLELSGKAIQVFSMYTSSEARGRFIGTELTREMGMIARDKGYTYAYSAILCGNSKSMHNLFLNPAIWPTYVYIEWNIEADPQVLEDQTVRFLEKRSG